MVVKFLASFFLLFLLLFFFCFDVVHCEENKNPPSESSEKKGGKEESKEGGKQDTEGGKQDTESPTEGGKQDTGTEGDPEKANSGDKEDNIAKRCVSGLIDKKKTTKAELLRIALTLVELKSTVLHTISEQIATIRENIIGKKSRRRRLAAERNEVEKEIEKDENKNNDSDENTNNDLKFQAKFDLGLANGAAKVQFGSIDNFIKKFNELLAASAESPENFRNKLNEFFEANINTDETKHPEKTTEVSNDDSNLRQLYELFLDNLQRDFMLIIKLISPEE